MTRLTIDRWIRDRARATPGRVAIDCRASGRTGSSTRAPTGSPAVARAAGDRVATLTGNKPEHVAVFFACAKAGRS